MKRIKNFAQDFLKNKILVWVCVLSISILSLSTFFSIRISDNFNLKVKVKSEAIIKQDVYKKVESIRKNTKNIKTTINDLMSWSKELIALLTSVVSLYALVRENKKRKH